MIVTTNVEDKEFKGNGSVFPFLKRIFTYSLRHKKSFWGFVIAVIVVGITDAIWPVIWMFFLDNEIVPLVNQYQEIRSNGSVVNIDFTALYKYFGWFFGNGVLQVIAVYYFILFAGNIQEFVLYDLRKEMFEKLQRLSYKFYDNSAMGWLLSRLTSDSDRVAELISWGFLDCMWGLTMIVSILVIMFYYNVTLAMIVFISIPILFLVSIRLRVLILKFSRKSRKINSEITANFTEHIQGVEVNKITSQEQSVSNNFKGLSSKMRKTTFRSTFYTAMYMPIVIFMGSLTAIIIINVGGTMAIAATAAISIGVLAAFFNYATRIFEPIMDITRFYAMAQNSLSAGERIFGLLDEDIEIKDHEDAKDLNNIKGQIEFKNVTFSYKEGINILRSFDLQIEAGTSVALVGATGSGKTTIANLVGRFYEISDGEILIDGHAIDKIRLKSLRSQMGIVLQTPHLFAGTVKENIRYGNLEATEKQILEVLNLLESEQFIDRLEEEVGESGENLSLGERQLISLARAILAEPGILIMDEATSSVDYITEKKIQKGIENLISNRTSIIVAHRLSTIKNCDRIILIDQGEIIEDGDHISLINKKGKYYDLYYR